MVLSSCYTLYINQTSILHIIGEMVYVQSFLISIHYTVIYFAFYSRSVEWRAVELRNKTRSYKMSASRNTSEVFALVFLLFWILPMSIAIAVFLISRGMLNSLRQVSLRPVWFCFSSSTALANSEICCFLYFPSWTGRYIYRFIN